MTPSALASVATTPDLGHGVGSGAFLLAQPLLLLGGDANAGNPIHLHPYLQPRWRRLRILLGEPPIQDEYDDYQPGTTLTLAEQREFFWQTRADTLALVDQLQSANVGDDVTAPHNDFGPLTARGWLRYLDIHASLESKKMR